MDAARAERLAKFELLKKKRAESHDLNIKALKSDKVVKVNPSLKQERKRKLAEELLKLREIEAEGLDSERIKNQTYSIEDVERWDEKVLDKKEKLDRGFTDFAQIAHKKYKKMISEFTPNISAYERQKQSNQQSIYRSAHSTEFANPDHQPDKEAVERLVQDIEKQNIRRGQFSRRRAFNEDEDVTYINERNMRFNKKVSRAYDEYTKEIKQNFERGTAL